MRGEGGRESKREGRTGGERKLGADDTYLLCMYLPTYYMYVAVASQPSGATATR